uniref:Uncharacterized protein n=1 Tax=Cyprinus carpio carpio TaxID=630221 RepID=A0A8C1C5K0_CYPCA
NWRKLKRAAKLLLCRLACIPSFFGGVLLERLLMIPVHLFICFCRYFRWLTFLLDLTGLSSASLMLLEAESMKLSRSLVPGKQKFKNCEFMMAVFLHVPLTSYNYLNLFAMEVDFSCIPAPVGILASA